VFNAERFLRECINSVLKQSLSQIEIICVDDASTDKSPAILKVYEKLDKRIKVLTQEKKTSEGAARNRGLKEAKGKYVVFWDADNLFEPDALERMYLQCEKDRAVICICGGSIYDVDKRLLVAADSWLDLSKIPPVIPFNSQKNSWVAFQFTNSLPSNKMFFRDFLVARNLSYQDMRSCSDVTFTYAALASAKRITVVDRPLVVLRKHSAHDTEATNVQNLQDADDKDLQDAEAQGQQDASSQGSYGFYDALLYLKKWLAKEKLTKTFARSYAELALNTCIDNLSNQRNKEEWLILAQRLKDEFFEDLGLHKHPASFYSNKKNYQIMKWLMKSSTEDIIAQESNLRKSEGFIQDIEEGALQKKEISIPQEAQESAPVQHDELVKVSVIIPVYNMEAHLEECLNSVLKQTLSDIEIICINDGSTDNSAAVLEQYKQKDARVNIITQDNCGLSEARSTGLRSAQGSYVAFLDGDDLLAWCALEQLYRQAVEKGLDVLFFEATGFYDSPQLYRKMSAYQLCYRYKNNYASVQNGKELFVELMSNKEFKPSACMQFIRRAFLEENHIDFSSRVLHEDNHFTLRSLMSAQKALVQREPLYLRRVRQDSAMAARDWSYIYGHLVCLGLTRQSLIEQGISSKEFIDAVAQWQTLIGASIATAYKNLDAAEVDAQIAALSADERGKTLLLLRSILQGENALHEKHKELVDQNRWFKAEIRNTKQSASYRVGSCLTWPARILKGRQ